MMTWRGIQGSRQGQSHHQGPAITNFTFGFSAAMRPPYAWARKNKNNCKKPLVELHRQHLTQHPFAAMQNTSMTSAKSVQVQSRKGQRAREDQRADNMQFTHV